MVEATAARPRVPAVRAFGVASGGYFPVSWGWGSLALLLLVSVALTVGVAVELDTLDALFLGGFGVIKE